jgi:hypothetical protein
MSVVAFDMSSSASRGSLQRKSSRRRLSSLDALCENQAEHVSM